MVNLLDSLVVLGLGFVLGLNIDKIKNIINLKPKPKKETFTHPELYHLTNEIYL